LRRRSDSRTPRRGRLGQPASPSRPIRAAGLRWPAEEDFELGKDCFGLDQSQVRFYTAIARHTALVMTAEFGMIPLAVPETGRLLAHPPPPDSARPGWTGGATTKPAHAGTTSEQDSPAIPQLSWSDTEWWLPY
jgi:hypothetical protein